jgi:arylsulfatase A-like enzyme
MNCNVGVLLVESCLVCLVVVLAGTRCAAHDVSTPGAKPPNIVVIMADDLGWMDLHCQGNPLLDTPHVDRLAAEGMRFTDAYAAAPVCTPTRAAMIEGMDTAIGRVLAALDELELAENTLLVFTSDNGSLFENTPLRENKGFLYEGGIRVPWIVRWPGNVDPGKVCSTPVITMDVFPTILEAAGLDHESPRPLDGESIVPLLRGTGSLNRRAIFFHYPNYAFHKQNRLGSAIREGHYKLIQYYDDGSVELYDLEDDVGETNNLADASPELARALQSKLEAWLRDAGARMPVRIASPAPAR